MQVIVNFHSAHMDPNDWLQPQQFRPERFLDESGNVVGRDRIVTFSLGKSTTYMSALYVAVSKFSRKYEFSRKYIMLLMHNNRYLTFNWFTYFVAVNYTACTHSPS